jgi:alkylation response protein AidB-like acyl-CoA dehydrogenase
MSLFNVRVPAATDSRRDAVRSWIAEHPQPTGREILDAGYMVPHWPRPWGIDADPIETYIINEELERAAISRPRYRIARDYAGPLILGAGTQAQRDRYLMPMLAGEEIWCQLFSEPGAGSDLASVRTRAVRDGDFYVINGQKTWSSQAHLASLGLLLVRTDPDLPKHKGISYMICPMKSPGITISPILSMEGDYRWNNTYFDDVRIPVENLIGEENSGWRLARETLANERMSQSSTGNLAWGDGPKYTDLVQLARARGGLKEQPEERQRLAQGYVDSEILHVLRMRALSRVHHQQSDDLAPEVRRALADGHGQRMLELFRDVFGVSGIAQAPDQPDAVPDTWSSYYFFARALTLGGGTSEIQRNVIAQRVLGMPRTL